MAGQRISVLTLEHTLYVPDHVTSEYRYTKKKFNFLNKPEPISVDEQHGEIRVPDEVIAKNNWLPGMKFSFVPHRPNTNKPTKRDDLEIYVVRTATIEDLPALPKEPIPVSNATAMIGINLSRVIYTPFPKGTSE
ncbi:MAG: hypothetical protein QM537_09265 [Candidatus Symbiobacter sp.]|nr:hypothetical protein [Candidatus Symbiobacter sp.]